MEQSEEEVNDRQASNPQDLKVLRDDSNAGSVSGSSNALHSTEPSSGEYPACHLNTDSSGKSNPGDRDLIDVFVADTCVGGTQTLSSTEPPSGQRILPTTQTSSKQSLTVPELYTLVLSTAKHRVRSQEVPDNFTEVERSGLEHSIGMLFMWAQGLDLSRLDSKVNQITGIYRAVRRTLIRIVRILNSVPQLQRVNNAQSAVFFSESESGDSNDSSGASDVEDETTKPRESASVSTKSSRIIEQLQLRVSALMHLLPTLRHDYEAARVYDFDEEPLDTSEHELQKHKMTYVLKCSSCSYQSVEAEAYFEHMESKHTLTKPQNDMQTSALLTSARVLVSADHSEEKCPMCSRKGFVSKRAFTNHVAQHMEEIALKSLQGALSTDGEAGENEVEPTWRNIPLQLKKNGSYVTLAAALLDTGADHCLINRPLANQVYEWGLTNFEPSRVKELISLDGSRVPVSTKVKFTFCIDETRYRTAFLVVPDDFGVSEVILGAKFISRHRHLLEGRTK